MTLICNDFHPTLRPSTGCRLALDALPRNGIQQRKTTMPTDLEDDDGGSAGRILRALFANPAELAAVLALPSERSERPATDAEEMTPVRASAILAELKPLVDETLFAVVRSNLEAKLGKLPDDPAADPEPRDPAMDVRFPHSARLIADSYPGAMSRSRLPRLAMTAADAKRYAERFPNAGRLKA
jgi:hypothetical protein